jgi:hypothetical protein
MHNARIAEEILSMVTPRDRAAAITGDLLEDSETPRQFWLSVARIAVSLVGEAIAAAPLQLLAVACLGWFVFMTITLGLQLLVWAGGYALVHHTVLEWTGLGVAFAWPPGPHGLAPWIESLVLLIWAPMKSGSYLARWRSGEAAAISLAIFLTWPLLASVITFVALSTKVTLTILPVIQAFAITGALRERRRSMPNPAGE